MCTSRSDIIVEPTLEGLLSVSGSPMKKITVTGNGTNILTLFFNRNYSTP